jgi:hypothetical protein
MVFLILGMLSGSKVERNLHRMTVNANACNRPVSRRVAVHSCKCFCVIQLIQCKCVGGFVIFGRVGELRRAQRRGLPTVIEQISGGTLAVSRAFGDKPFKVPHSKVSLFFLVPNAQCDRSSIR